LVLDITIQYAATLNLVVTSIFQYYTDVCIWSDREDDYAITEGFGASRGQGIVQPFQLPV